MASERIRPAAPMLRKTFDVSKKIKRYVAFVTGLDIELASTARLVMMPIPNQTN